jgi:oxalate decarboxylase
MSAAEPVRDGEGADIVGPRNADRERQNPFTVSPPASDHGTMPNLKWSFADSHIRIEEGGWARETTVRELPISKAMAGVNMRLKAGAVRELHWHKEAEWSHMLKGKARITAVDEMGRTFADDVGEGDLWYFPPGIPHSIQGLDSDVDGCEFLRVFDDGSFSEDSTFLLTDWLAHKQPDVLAKNFRTSESKLERLPSKELYIFPAPKPGALSEDRQRAPARFLTHSATVCWSTSRTAWPVALSASLIPQTFPPAGRSRLPWSSWSPAACASCTGIRMLTSGNITSRARVA